MTDQSLIQLFRTRLGATQTVLQVERFQSDLYRANHALMKAALQEAQSIASRTGAPRDAREAVNALYDARVAELAQMFPVFFIFESAYRSFTAARLAVAYEDDLWWAPIRQAVMNNRDPRTITHLGARPARRDTLDAVTHLLRSLNHQTLGSLAGTYDLLEAGTLGHVGRLIAANWTEIEPTFHRDGHPPLTASNFRDQFNKVRLARNDAYHHRMIAGRSKVVATAERLLDLLDAHLGNRVDALQNAPIQPLAFTTAVEARHA